MKINPADIARQRLNEQIEEILLSIVDDVTMWWFFSFLREMAEGFKAGFEGSYTTGGMGGVGKQSYRVSGAGGSSLQNSFFHNFDSVAYQRDIEEAFSINQKIESNNQEKEQIPERSGGRKF